MNSELQTCSKNRLVKRFVFLFFLFGNHFGSPLVKKILHHIINLLKNVYFTMQSKQYSITLLIYKIQFLPKILSFHAISQIVIPTFFTLICVITLTFWNKLNICSSYIIYWCFMPSVRHAFLNFNLNITSIFTTNLQLNNVLKS